MKIELIAPRKKVINNHREHWDGGFISFLLGKKQYSSAYLALPTLASLTPKQIEINITDENIEDINFDKNVDLVGITTPTFLALRAYEIADKFRKRGVTVVLGGIHPTMMPEEALQHADAIIVGEAEYVWGQLIKDFENKKLKKRYVASKRPELDEQPIPRWDLLKNSYYRFHTLQTSRGCPYDCEFCSVKAFLGKRYRCKSVGRVLQEVKTLINIEKKGIFFVDDNFIGNKRRAKEILRSLIPYKLVYYIQASLDIAQDDELLEILRDSGCRNVFIGFESISDKAITQMNKTSPNKTKDYFKNIKKIQSYGIAIQGSFIFGHDSDCIAVFKKTVDFINRAELESTVFHVLTPFPGTGVFKRLEKEERIISNNWNLYDATHVCFKPKQMSIDELENGYRWVYQQVYSYESIFKRLRGVWELWNETEVRNWDRISPIISNLSGNDRAYTLELGSEPETFRNKSSNN